MSNKKKAAAALALGTLVFGTQALVADHGSGADIRTKLLQEEPVADSLDHLIAGCPGGKCPRPEVPPKKKNGKRQNLDNKLAQDSCGVGTCGSEDDKDKKKPNPWGVS